jgi:hypothetical protein
MIKRKINFEQELELIDLYKNGTSTAELCLKYGWKLSNRRGPLDILKAHNVLIRKDNETHAYRYTINENFFEIINSKEKAYFLGLLYSDGSVNKDKNTVSIGLAEKDIAILELFNKSINSNKPLRKNILSNIKHQNSVILVLENKKIKEQLIKLGCVPNKSILNISLPNIPEEFLPHFIRGVFDGDGCITYTNIKKYPTKYRPIVSFAGGFSFISEIAEVLKNTIGINHNKFQKRHKSRSVNSGHISWNGFNTCKKIYDYLYKDCQDLFLIRKQTKFIALLKGDFKKESL